MFANSVDFGLWHGFHPVLTVSVYKVQFPWSTVSQRETPTSNREVPMTDAADLKRSIKVCMFDQYGTVVDMQGGSDRDRDAVPRAEGLEGQPEQLRHLVAAHAFRELDDRRAAAQGAHALSRDRAPRRVLRHGPRRHRLHAGRSALPGRRDREAASIPGGARGAGPAADALQARRAVQRRSGHAGDRQAVSRGPVRPGDLGRRSQLASSRTSPPTPRRPSWPG